MDRFLQNIKKDFKSYFFITFGALLVALAIVCFFDPNKIAAGGVMGISIIVNHFFPVLSVGILMLVMNIALFIVAFIFIGGNFGGKSIYSALMLSFMTEVLSRVFGNNLALTNDLMLASIFGTLLGGIGLGMVFNQNASTGGTDILAKILNKYFHIDMGKSLMAIDFIVTLGCAYTFGANVGMFALLCVIMNGFVIDGFIDGMNVCKQVMVVSAKNNEISKFIMDELDRGCTLLEGKGAFSGKNTYILYTVLNRKEFIKLKNYIKDVDKRAFITVTDSHEVLGEGFKDIFGEG